MNQSNEPGIPPRSAQSIPKPLWQKILGIGSIGCCLGLCAPGIAWAYPPPVVAPTADNIDQIVLPPASDVPEEILRTEIIFEARSPLDGSPMSPADYAQLQAELAAPQTIPTLNSDIRYIIFLLQARRTFKPVIPFLP